MNLMVAMLFLQAVAESTRIDESFIAKNQFVVPAPFLRGGRQDDPLPSVLNVIDGTSDQSKLCDPGGDCCCRLQAKKT